MHKGDNLRRIVSAQRPSYDGGRYLSVNELKKEQSYCLQRLRRHNRHLHGWGVVCGLWVVPVNDANRPWAVQVCPGYALGPYGDEIYVPAPTTVDVADYLWRRPLKSDSTPYVGIRYAEQEARPIPTKTPGCGCEETTYKPSRIRDSFQVDIIWLLKMNVIGDDTPPTTSSDELDLCKETLNDCPECPSTPYVLLARLGLPTRERDPITQGYIQNLKVRL